MPGLLPAAAVLSVALALGCNSSVPPKSAVPQQAHAPDPVRPTATPAPFKLLHQTDNSLILVTPADATNDQLAALVWQLHDVAEHHRFTELHLPQTFIDARHPSIFFHIYRSPRCATETYGKGPYPCGASYHGAADFSFGGITNRNRIAGALIDANGNPTPLWSDQ